MAGTYTPGTQTQKLLAMIMLVLILGFAALVWVLTDDDTPDHTPMQVPADTISEVRAYCERQPYPTPAGVEYCIREELPNW